MSPVTVQAPRAWMGRTLTACDPESGPFTVLFDDQAQAHLLPSQAAHLCAVSGVGVTILPVAPETETPVIDVAVAFPDQMPAQKVPTRRKKGL